MPWEPQDDAAPPSEVVEDFINARHTAAHGALKLGIPELANDELEEIPHVHRLTRYVMKLLFNGQIVENFAHYPHEKS